MRILSIDTTSDFGSLALRENGSTLEEMPIHATSGFSQVLFGYFDSLLKRHDWPLATVDVFAAAAGPGSFTGVRVGLTAAKGLADAVGRGALAVSNLQALAVHGETDARGVVIDARRGEVYAAVYDEELRVVSGELVTRLPTWLSTVTVTPKEIISPNFAPFRDSFPLHVPVIERMTLASAIADIAERTPAVDPAFLDANYVRRSDAELVLDRQIDEDQRRDEEQRRHDVIRRSGEQQQIDRRGDRKYERGMQWLIDEFVNQDRKPEQQEHGVMNKGMAAQQ